MANLLPPDVAFDLWTGHGKSEESYTSSNENRLKNAFPPKEIPCIHKNNEA